MKNSFVIISPIVKTLQSVPLNHLYQVLMSLSGSPQGTLARVPYLQTQAFSPSKSKDSQGPTRPALHLGRSTSPRELDSLNKNHPRTCCLREYQVTLI